MWQQNARETERRDIQKKTWDNIYNEKLLQMYIWELLQTVQL